ncbi:MAG: fructosamine kinase family protein [Bacteroidia bacterium]|nr:fructosamine kinase family protein [Bacteroidia bacterium]NNF29834.1 phosphotransferase [Flavobacteriaceae bacterium]MBT8275966.1 fructosamine kinase family protein [Bacteroidia bacterium]NNJ82988.1 phosphotransferase [Flavobacteriaceae bacterium]NNK53806.1 phosphotransferase [Flavobacteriaceae bacterium]
METTIRSIAELHSLVLEGITPLAGGDINEVYLLQTSSGNLVVKLNNAERFPKMFETEKAGLELLSSTNTFRIPEVIANGETENTSYLLLEYILPGSKSTGFWTDFGVNLARLHKNRSDLYGWKHNNYIGSLFQSNAFTIKASDFYINERLRPQVNLARQNGYLTEDLTRFFKRVSEIIPNEPPALIHGDLWNGNYMVDKEGRPVLIDPSVSYSHREMDLAMMQLFGGFPSEVFLVYNEELPLESGWEERVSLWQLYYLLVHLNLFGAGYLGQVRSAISKYS